MKLISKYKDYYDYLQGIYGIDELIVYDRRGEIQEPSEFYPINSFNEPQVVSYNFAICNKEYTVYQYKEKFYHTPIQILKLNKEIQKDGKVGYLSYSRRKIETLEQASIHYMKNNHSNTSINEILRKPVLICVGDFMEDRKDPKSWKVPNLQKYGVGSWYRAEEIWKDIYSFISYLKDNPEIPNKQTDLEKLQAHGFDKKVSFRHRNN